MATVATVEMATDSAWYLGKTVPVKGEGRGLYVNMDGYLEVCRRGPNRGKKAHRLYMERCIGRPLRSDEEVHHVCGNRQCWPPTDFHLVLMDAVLHHASDAGRSPHWKRKGSNGTRPLL